MSQESRKYTEIFAGVINYIVNTEIHRNAQFDLKIVNCGERRKIIAISMW